MARATVQEPLSLALEDVNVRQLREDCYRVKFVTSRGTNQGILHHRDVCKSAAVLVSGAGGGFDGPAGIYRDLGPELLDYNISTLRLDYRYRNHLEECVLDTLLGLEFMKDLHLNRAAVAGWSFGGAVAIDAGVISDAVVAVITIASQTYGTGAVDDLAPKALLLIHGTGDRTLPHSCSEDIYTRAREPKELVLFKGANHGVDEKRDEMKRAVKDFVVRHLT